MSKGYCYLLVPAASPAERSEEHTSELQSQSNLVCRLLLEKKNNTKHRNLTHTGCLFRLKPFVGAAALIGLHPRPQSTLSASCASLCWDITCSFYAHSAAAS